MPLPLVLSGPPLVVDAVPFEAISDCGADEPRALLAGFTFEPRTEAAPIKGVLRLLEDILVLLESMPAWCAYWVEGGDEGRSSSPVGCRLRPIITSPALNISHRTINISRKRTYC